MTRQLPPLAYVRYINAVADTFNTDFRAVDQVAYSQPFLNVAFKALGDGNFQGYQAGNRHVRIFLDPAPPNTSTPTDPAIVSTVLADSTLSLTAGHYYTLILTGHARAPGNTKLWVIEDASMPATPAGLAYRVVNAAAVQGAVDLHIVADSTTPTAGAATVANLAAGATTAYLPQAVGAFYVRLTTPGTLTAVGKANGYILQAGTAGTTAADPIYGSGQAGSIFEIFVFDATPVPASPQATVSATPSVVYFPDVQPPRTTSP